MSGFIYCPEVAGNPIAIEAKFKEGAVHAACWLKGRGETAG